MKKGTFYGTKVKILIEKGKVKGLKMSNIKFNFIRIYSIKIIIFFKTYYFFAKSTI